MQQIGRYAIFDEIAAGGMAAVHLARLAGPLGFSRIVAAKRLHPHLLDDEDFKRMFLDEARLAARIRHPNVVPTLDVLVTDREIILVMEYVHGESVLALHRASRERGIAVPLPIAAAILVSVLHGLHAAHEATSENGDPLRIVHRDVSPHNVLVGLDGAVRLLDFGVAKAIQARPDTRPGTLKGKFSYMAPEVLRGEGVTRQADIFAAAVVFWELVTGRKLFGGANEHERMLKILAGDYPAPSTVVADLPGVVDRVVMKALHPDASARYTTALEMAVEIETLLAPASQRVVGEWVKDLAGAVLERRAELLQQIEISHIHSVPPLHVVGGPDEEGAGRAGDAQSDDAVRLLTSFGMGTPKTGSKSRRGIWAGAVSGLAVAVAAAALLRARPSPTESVPQKAPVTAAPAAAAIEPPLAPSPSATAAANPAQVPQDPIAAVDRPGQRTGVADARTSQPRAQGTPRQVRPATPARRSPTRSSGNARTFLPDDL